MQDICSIWAYEDIKKSGYIGERQSRILAVFAMNPEKPLSATEVIELLGRTTSESTRNRITELQKMGFLRKFDRINCPVTNKKVNRWIYTGNRKPKDCVIEEVCCSKCKGKGVVQQKVYK